MKIGMNLLLWADHVTSLRFDRQQWYVVLAGAGMGLMLGPASTDAVNRASTLSYGEATGITQTVRNYAASLGLAILGTVLLTQMRAHLTASFESMGMSGSRAAAAAAGLAQNHAGGAGPGSVPHVVRLDFAYATRSVLVGMALVMAVAAAVGLVGLRRGVQEVPAESAHVPIPDGEVTPG